MKRIEMTLQTKDALHIGSGSTGIGSSSVAAVQRARGKPIIPGSTLRGKLRWNLQRMTPILRRVADGPLLEYFNKYRSDASVVSDFFGAEEHKGKLIVCDGKLLDSTITGTVPGIRLDRKTRTAERGALFFHEVVPPQARFIFNIILDVPSSIPEDENEVNLFIALFLAKSLEKEGLGRKRARVSVDLGEYAKDLDGMKGRLLRNE